MKKIILPILISIIFMTGCLNRKPTVNIEEYSEVPSDNTTEYSSEDDVNSKNLKKTQKLIDAMLNNKTVRDGLNSKYLNEIHKDISGFYFVDMDHDSENEILFTLVGAENAYYMLDYSEGQVYYSNVSFYKNYEKMVPNKNGYWQAVYQDGIILFAVFEDDATKDRLVIDLGKYSLNNEEISKEAAQDLANRYYAEPATCYEYSKDNIEKYLKIELSETAVYDDYFNELNLMQMVLLDKENFYDIKSKVYKSINNLTEDGLHNNYSTLWYIDFNNDNNKEVEMCHFGYIYIFYEYDGQIYMEETYYDSMSTIYEDGSFGEWRTGERYRITEFTSEGMMKESVTVNGSDKEAFGCSITRYNIINALSD